MPPNPPAPPVGPRCAGCGGVVVGGDPVAVQPATRKVWHLACDPSVNRPAPVPPPVTP